MDAETAINVAFATFLLLFAFVIWRFCRTPQPRARGVIAAARADVAQHDIGPDNLRLLQDLEAHIDAYGATIAGLYEPPHIAPDPVLAAGCERLRDAIRDSQTEGGDRR